jgi:hypothetical protein
MASALIYFQFLLFGFSYPSDLPYSEIENSFESNNSEYIISNCEDIVLLMLDGEEGVYTHPQATMVLNDFFEDYPKGDFEYAFQGKNSDEEIFSVAYYRVSVNKFTVLFSFSKQENKIESIRISK